MQAVAEDGFDVDVSDEQVFFKAGRSGNDPAILIDDEAAAIKDEFVLTAYEVAKCENGAVVGGACGNHLLAQEFFAVVKGRGGNVDEEFGISCKGLLPGRATGIPDVFAYGNAKCDAVEAVDAWGIARLEVTIFIKDTVIGQVGFVVDVDEVPVTGNGCGIVNVGLAVGKADDGSNALCCFYKFVKYAAAGVKETRFEEQVFGGVTCNGEFWKDD